ncbi:nuclear transport factor 2 family protein [Duganella sp. FT92W]|uniref:Nuclear transport factor 2 family protein n=1 Tax=Pseudoduganella rivuli TaxID=2666085 RepID=A0A7X2LS87_9BURK|nr:nuclear transport factor 2 family protein [Pseudoduganella rivuli]MRV70544.1 nuclear transport factor 2 family protein [Pseudoduganella rivuli]
MTDRDAIDHFLHGQIECWNASDKEGFFAHYRRIAPEGLDIEYVGRPRHDPWQVLEGMWAQQNARIRIEVASCIVNGNEAACHHRNVLRDGSGGIDTIETYRFDGGRLYVRYFVALP